MLQSNPVVLTVVKMGGKGKKSSYLHYLEGNRCAGLLQGEMFYHYIKDCRRVKLELGYLWDEDVVNDCFFKPFS